MLTSLSARNHVCRQCLITVRINKVRRERGVSILFLLFVFGQHGSGDWSVFIYIHDKEIGPRGD